MKKFDGRNLWCQSAPGLLLFALLLASPFHAFSQGVINNNYTTGADLDSLFSSPTNSVIVNPGVTIDNSASGSDAVSGSSQAWNLTNNGATLNGGINGVNFQAGGSVNNLTNGIIAGNGRDGVTISGGAGSVINAGSIVGPDHTGVELFFSGDSVSNLSSGTISGFYDGVAISGGASTVDNAGTITGDNSDGVALSGGGTVDNRSSGKITGDYNGVDIYAGSGSVVNAGTITGTNNDGVYLGQGGSVSNLSGGTISGDYNGVEIDGGTGSVANGGSITGTNDGVYLGAGGSVTNLSDGTISGNTNGVDIAGSHGTVINSGSITGKNNDGVYFSAGGSVNNLAGGSITGGTAVGIYGAPGSVANAGLLSGSGTGVYLGSGGSVNNLMDGTIAGGSYGLQISGGLGALTNAGSITTSGSYGVYMDSGGSVENLSGATISGGGYGVSISGGAGAVVNTGSITGDSYGIYLSSGGSVSNLSGGTISGGGYGVGISGGLGALTNAGSITGVVGGIYFGNGGSVENLSGGTISGGNYGVLTEGGGSVTNAGSITGNNNDGVYMDSGGSVNNLSGGTIQGGQNGVEIDGSAGSVVNAGSIIGTNGDGVYMDSGGSVNNLSGGSIQGGLNGNGVEIDGAAGSVDNDGSIKGITGMLLWQGGSVNNESSGIIEGGYNGVTLLNSGSVTNAGSITGVDNDGVYLVDGSSLNNEPNGIIAGGLNGVELNYGVGSVDNVGSINGTNGDGIIFYGYGSVTNEARGRIVGGNNGVEIDGGLGTVINSGLINGTNNNGVYLGAGGSVSNLSGGTISGEVYGVETSGGTGSVYNAGTIIGSSGTSISMDSGSSNNTVTLDTGSVVQGNIVGNGGTDAIYLQGTGSYGDNFNNFSTLTMGANNRGGNWNLTSNNTFAQSATVQSGLLQINGSLTTPLTEVDAAGGLGGAGVINGTVDNHGYLAPGNNSIGTLTINGSMTNWGNYDADVNAAGNSDLIMVNGTAKINGGDVIVQPESGMYAAQTRYLILTATNGVSGMYAGSSIATNMPPPGLFSLIGSSLQYDLNDVYLVVTRGSFTSVARTFNQKSVASVLEGASQVNSSPTMTNLITQFLVSSNSQAAQAALDSLSGDIYGTLGMLDVQQQNAFNGSMAQRTGRISAGSQSGEFATSWKPVQLASAGSTLPQMPQAQVSQPLDFWLQGVGSFGHMDGDGNAEGGNYTIGGASGGLDYRVCPQMLVGLGLGYSHDNADVGGPGASGKVDAYQIGGYGGYVNGPWHLDNILSYGYLQSATKRLINVGSISQEADGNYDGGVFSLSTEGGYAFKLNWLTVEPSVGLNYAHLWQDAFSETGSSGGNNYGLNVNSMNLNSVRSTVGLRLAAQLGQKDGVQFLPALHALWEHEFADRYADINASFVGGSSTFDTHGLELGANTALLGGGLTVAFNKTIQGFVNYDANLNSQLTSSTFSGGLSISW